MALNQDQQYYSTTGNYYTPIYYNTDYYNQNLNNKHHGFYENNNVYLNQGLYEIPIRTNTVYRRVYSSRQTLILENEFKLNPFLTKSTKAELAHVLNLEEKQIKIWYQNQRAKQRRDFKNSRSESNSSS
uniref:Homeobox domain-containing protein n=1 Tax=Rhabditophanes sp. KR3021 TaxID=114890 RepID=A0AC35UB76_9BILA